MANNASSTAYSGIIFNGLCPSPFLDQRDFPHRGGSLDGRLCAPIPTLPGQPDCCLPCPATEWVFSDSFAKWSLAASWLNVIGLFLLIFMLISYAILPTEKTRSHYLSICLIIAISFITIGFTIPLAGKPDPCFDPITPNDMYTSSQCAWSGGFIVAGGLTTTVWIFVKALSMNLQICWDVIPGKKFFYASQVLGWGISAILFATTMTFTGVSFRFGTGCHINHANAMAGFWGPLMAIAAAAGLLQLMTFIFCIHVYLKNLWNDDHVSSTTTGTQTSTTTTRLPSYNTSVRTQLARAVYQRLKKVLWLQWRGIANVTIILVDVVFFAIVFLTLDGMRELIVHNTDRLAGWYYCLVEHPDHPKTCLRFVEGWLIKEPIVVAVLIMMSLAGLQSFCLLMRPTVFRAWWELIMGAKGRGRKEEFVSLDARNASLSPRTDGLPFSSLGGGYQPSMLQMQQSKTSGESDGASTLHATSKTHFTIMSRPEEVYSPSSRLSHFPSTRDGESGRPPSPPLPPLITSPPNRTGRGQQRPTESAGRITSSPVSDAPAWSERYMSNRQRNFNDALSPTSSLRRHGPSASSNSRVIFPSTSQGPPRRSVSKSSMSNTSPVQARSGLNLIPSATEEAEKIELERDGGGYWKRRDGMI